MKVIASPREVEYVLARGGRLCAWASATACCGGTWFIEASTAASADAGRFTAMLADDFELFVRTAGPNGLPA